MSNKHAYLIIAHNQFDLLKLLLKQIDYIYNDIFLLIDKKANFNDTKSLIDCLEHSNIYIYQSIKIYWGDFSQIEAELFLFKKAYKKKYHYYHLISGVDLLLKSSSEIYYFFENSNDTEFVSFDEIDVKNDITAQRYLYYWPLIKYKNNVILNVLNSFIVKVQKMLNIKRNLYKQFSKGPNWVSITHNFLEYLLQHEDEIKKTYKMTLCCDEVFLQTVLYNSPFYKQISSNGNLRLVLWNHSNDKSPKIITMDDFNLIRTTDAMFARKFNLNLDSKIIEYVLKH